MIGIYEINTARTQVELDQIVNRAAAERGCELDASSSYAEAAAWFEEEAPKAGNGSAGQQELAILLRAAETRWFELD